MAELYVDELKSSLLTHKDLLELLTRKIAILKKKIESYYKVFEQGEPTNKYELELEIIDWRVNIIDTQGRIDSLRKIITEKENYYTKFCESFDANRKEAEENFDRTLREANAKRKFMPSVDQFLKSANIEACKTNIEVKVEAYKRLKALLK